MGKSLHESKKPTSFAVKHMRKASSDEFIGGRVSPAKQKSLGDDSSCPADLIEQSSSSNTIEVIHTEDYGEEERKMINSESLVATVVVAGGAGTPDEAV